MVRAPQRAAPLGHTSLAERTRPALAFLAAG